MKTVFVSIPIGRCVKNFLYTDVFRELRRKYRVCIFSPLVKFPEFIEEFQHPNVVFYDEPAFDSRKKQRFWSKVYEPVRYFQHLIKFRGNTTKYHWRYARAKATGGFWKNMLMVAGLLPWGGFQTLNRLSAPWLFHHGYYQRIFEDEKPHLVISTCFTLEDFLMLYQAGRKGIPSLFLGESWQNFITDGRFPVRADKIAVWSEMMAEEAIRCHNFKERDVIVTGIPLYDEYCFHTKFMSREEFGIYKDIPERAKIITYICSSGGVIPQEQKLIDEWVRCIESGKLGDVILILRLNPHWNQEKYRELYSAHPRIRLDIPHPSYSGSYCRTWWREDSNYHYVNLIRNSDVVLTSISIAVLEAALFNRPIINVAYDPSLTHPDASFTATYRYSESYSHAISSGGVKLARSPEELVQYIQTYLENPALDSEGRQRIVHQYCGAVDGQASWRVLDICEKLMSQVSEAVDGGF